MGQGQELISFDAVRAEKLQKLNFTVMVFMVHHLFACFRDPVAEMFLCMCYLQPHNLSMLSNSSQTLCLAEGSSFLRASHILKTWIFQQDLIVSAPTIG